MASEVVAHVGTRTVQSSGDLTLAPPTKKSVKPVEPIPAQDESKSLTLRQVLSEDGKDVPLQVGGQKEEQNEVPNEEQLAETVSHVNEYVQNMQRNLEFDVDEESNRTIIRVTDAESGELIRQIPSEEFLKLAEKMEDMDGLLVNEKA